MKLLIVESPAKAKTVSKYLDGKYTVRASVGHIRDLPKNNKKAVAVEDGFEPRYEIAKGKEKVVAELKKLAGRADEIVLATDPDREGEAIAWHIMEAIGEGNPKKSKTAKGPQVKRIVFHEITESALKEAMEHPRDIDQNLRKAQEARRVLDRLVGYDLSGLIWKKVRYGLSAGRVQSPALRILAEREREIQAFRPESFWTITAETESGAGELVLTCSLEPKDEKEKERIVAAGERGRWKVTGVAETEAKRAARAPFTTSTLQQAASSRLGLSPARTMALAQKLYEAGLITYMRTDSFNLSENALAQASALVKEKYGENYAERKSYKTKSKSAQEAHEAVRPTDLYRIEAGGSEAEKKLYKLIWRRVVASQMADARVLRAKITAGAEGEDIPEFYATGSRVVFDGWLQADPAARGEDVEVPKVKGGESLKLRKMNAEKKETVPPPRYSEAGLVKELEKRGIGRPSTYASIIKTLHDRGYTEKNGRSLEPTDTGMVVSGFLEDNFPSYISDSFTAEMEDELDEIAAGKREYASTLRSFYGPFRKDIDDKDKNLAKATNLGKADDKFKCPVCGAGMIIKLGKSGRFLSCEKFPECSGSRTMEGEEMAGPKETGENCPKCKEGKLVERVGKYGPFIACNRYPKCRYVKEDKEAEKEKATGVACPICGKGVMVEKKGRFGTFFGCSNYPDCKHIIKTRPTGRICELCGALMMEGTKTIPERCSNKTCPMHNPHKMAK